MKHSESPQKIPLSSQAKRQLLSGFINRYEVAAMKQTKTRILDEFCSVTGFERKYASKLLSGNREPQKRPGRGKTYTDDVAKVIIRIWELSEYQCPLYLKAQMEACVHDMKSIWNIPEAIIPKLKKASVSTIRRIIRGRPKKPMGSSRRNPLPRKTTEFDFIEVCSGERTPAYECEPGDIQIDTVALCGGSLKGSFFWILTVTDRATQWTEIYPIWNKGSESLFEALEAILKRFPFKVTKIHCDNGSEFINAHLLRFCKEHPTYTFSRSRPRTCNDNAHVEQKNSAMVRKIFGERRFDNPALFSLIEQICRHFSDLFNYRRVCRMTISKERCENSKKYKRTYDTPKYPAQRVLDKAKLSKRKRKSLKKKSKSMNGLYLTQSYQRALKRLHKKQDEYDRRLYRQVQETVQNESTASMFSDFDHKDKEEQIR